ncbi:MAG: SusE domain-containing protein, partial [Lutibacter sp.]|nr:SusE domain-containing protein [Lutibacter sp.]
MKNILKISTLALLLFAGVSCENDDQTIATPSGGPELITPLDGSAYVLLPENATNEATTLVWNHADYDVQTEVNYDVEVALAGTDFTTIIPAGSTTSRFVVWTVEGLNTVALEAGLIPYTAGDLDVRIKSSLGSNDDLPSYSNVITLTVTPYTTDLPKLAVAGNHQGWNAGNAPLLAASDFGRTDFEGYVWLDGEFKFVAQSADGTFNFPPAGGPDYGDNGDFSGILAETGESNCTAIAGYYRVRANTGAITTLNPEGLTYSTTAVSWG